MLAYIPQQVEFDIKQAYEFFEREYEEAFQNTLFRQEFNPPKLTRILTTDTEGNPKASCSVMWARLPIAGYFGTKTIYYSYEKPVKRSARTVLFNSQGDIENIFDSENLTAIRCGLLTILAIKRTGLEFSSGIIGLVGYGKINQTVKKVLASYYPNLKFVIRDPSNQAISYYDLWEDSTKPTELLNMCDVIVTATTSSDLSQTLTLKEVRNNHNQLVVCLDLGWAFRDSLEDPLVKTCTDHTEQLLEHWKEEFPWTSKIPCHLPVMTKKDCPKFEGNEIIMSFIYGVAISDIAIAAYLSQKI